MKLYIAEKPSLGRAIAAVLPKPHNKQDGFIKLANGDCVTWCIGHLLEQAEPEQYDSQFKKWNLEHLPIIPNNWQLQAKSKTKKQLSVVKKLIKQADVLINAGDPDREGQLLVDEVINYAKPNQIKIKQAQRLLISDLNPAAVTQAIKQMKSNQDFIALSTSALARARADWLYGLNMTRAYTLQGQKVGYAGVLSVGRVQTPVLGLVVKRCLEINQFTSKTYYEVLAHLLTDDQQTFTAKWQPSTACQNYMDDENRIISKPLAENVIKRITNQPAIIDKIDKQTKRLNPPLPYNLSKLQIDANKRYGINAKQCLDICQSLYEKHKLITYPRSDNQYLPQAQFSQAANIIATIKKNDSKLTSACDHADHKLKSKTWNDSKVEAHHAIIPTSAHKNTKSLNGHEQNVYQLICQQYLAQFYPAHQYQEQQVSIIIENGLFIAKDKKMTVQGWKAIYARVGNNSSSTQTSSTTNNADNDNEQSLPVLQQGQQLSCVEGQLLEKQTTPPKLYTDASLLSAMTGISRFVQDANIKKILKDTDGLGTEATRAGIIELLIKRQFISRQGKNLVATEAGIALIKSLPTSASLPDMTARWESELNKISQKQLKYQDFILPLTSQLHSLILDATQSLPEALRGITTKSPSYKRQKSWKKKSYKKANSAK